MAKQKRKVSLPPFMEHLKDRFFRIVTNVSVFVILVIVVTLLVQAFLYRSDYFNLRAVETRETALDNQSMVYIDSKVLSSYKGRNIFTIDLKGIADFLRGVFPDARKVMVRLALPDKIVMTIQFRRPVALVKGSRYYPVDNEGVVLQNANSKLFKFLPVIEGVRIRPNARTAVRGVPYRNLRFALELLDEIRCAKCMADFTIVSINAVDAKDLSFTLKNGVQVKIGFEHFKTRLQTLGKVLKDPRMLMNRIEYIDVRFKDVVIGPRQV